MSGSFGSGPVTVRVPATSANLGPGFDALGLALTLHDEVCAEVTGGGTTVTVSGEGAAELPGDERHLVARAMHAVFDERGVRPPGLALTCHNRIPQERGLGSSAAAIVAGVLLARALIDGGFDDDAGLRLAAALEGHPDNVAACLRGGLTIAWSGEPEGVRTVRLSPAGALQPTVFIPERRGRTAAARSVLPATVPHADAAHAAGRAALLVHALTTAPELLLEATEDRLHQDYRAPGMPETIELLRRLRAAGVAATVSGAGPAILALTPVPSGFRPGPGVVRHALGIDRCGAVVRAGTLARYAR